MAFFSKEGSVSWESHPPLQHIFTGMFPKPLQNWISNDRKRVPQRYGLLPLCLLHFSFPECLCLPAFSLPWVEWCSSSLLDSSLSLDSSSPRDKSLVPSLSPAFSRYKIPSPGNTGTCELVDTMTACSVLGANPCKNVWWPGRTDCELPTCQLNPETL